MPPGWAIVVSCVLDQSVADDLDLRLGAHDLKLLAPPSEIDANAVVAVPRGLGGTVRV